MFYKCGPSFYNKEEASRKYNVFLRKVCGVYGQTLDGGNMNLEFGKKIAALRKMQKRTQTELAEYLCVQPQTVSRWEAEGGTPDVSLLPKSALFFGVTLDELFGVTDMEQIENLVYKYSVLRDEKSFEEVLRSLENGISVMEEELKKNSNNVDARAKREQFLAWKVHVYIQKSRKAKEDAEKILDSLIEEVTAKDNPLYQSLRLQKLQFMAQSGEGTTAVTEAKRIWENDSNIENLYYYMVALLETDRDAEILQLWEEENVLRLVAEVTSETIPLWHIMFEGAVRERNLSFFEKYYQKFKQNASCSDLFGVEWGLTQLYKTLEMQEKKEKCKEQLLRELSILTCNKYLKDWYRNKIKEL